MGWLPKPRLKAQSCLGPDPECISPRLHLPRPLIFGPVAWWIWFQLCYSLERSSDTSTSAIPLNSDLHSPSTSMCPRNCTSGSKSSFRIPQWNAIRHRILNRLISSRVFHPQLFVSSHIPNQQHSQHFRHLEVAFFQAAWSLLLANGATEIPHPTSPWSGMMLVCSFNVNSHPIPSTQISMALTGLPCRHSRSHTHTTQERAPEVWLPTLNHYQPKKTRVQSRLPPYKQLHTLIRTTTLPNSEVEPIFGLTYTHTSNLNIT